MSLHVPPTSQIVDFTEEYSNFGKGHDHNDHDRHDRHDHDARHHHDDHDHGQAKKTLKAWARNYLRQCDPAIVGQHGDDHAFNTAGHLLAGRYETESGPSLTVDEVVSAMMAEWNGRCSPPWSESELRTKVESADRNGTPRPIKIIHDHDGELWGKSADGVYPMDALGNAEHFVALYGDELRHVTLWKTWLVWDGRRWKRDETAKVKRMAQRFVRNDMLDAEKRIADDDARGKYHKWITQSRSPYIFESMLSHAATILAVSPNELDCNGDLLNVQNGTIDLSNGSFRPHEKTDLLTKISAVPYDPDAKCPLWEKFINRVFQNADGTPREDVIRYVQKAVGYSMTADTSSQCLFILNGRGQNGKTTFMDAILNILGDYGIVGQQSLLLDDGKGRNNSHDETDLFGVRLASCSEVSDGQRFDESKVKRLVGTQTIRAARKYENSFEFRSTHKLWLDCNSMPKAKRPDDALCRRIKPIPFLVQIPRDERDEQLPMKLKSEASGILNWMLDGLKGWLADGRKLHEPDEVRIAVNQFRSENDLFARFLGDCIEPNDVARETTDNVYSAYSKWMHHNAMGNNAMNKITFGKVMGERGYPSKMSDGQRYYVGLSLLIEASVKGDGEGNERANYADANDDRKF